jgi:hypothetical protein
VTGPYVGISLFPLIKCCVLQIGYNDTSISYFLGPNKLNLTNDCRDLGVLFQSSLKPSIHCSKIAKQANARSKLILKSFLSHNYSTLIKAFKTFVRPILEYASPVWSPSLIKDINIIEHVQSSFTYNVCVLCNLPYMSYDQRLEYFNLERLELRRVHFDLIELYKIVNKYTVSNLHNALQFCNLATHNTRGHRFKLVVNRTRTNLFKNHFVNRVVNIWNCLPADCFNSNLTICFKRKICKLDLSNFMHGRL